MSHFGDLLNAVLKDVSGEQTMPELENLSDEYLETIQKIDQIKAQLQDLFNDLDVIKKKTLTTLAIASKSRQPDVNISIDDELKIGGDNQSCVVKDPTSCMVNQEERSFESPEELGEFILTFFLPECRGGRGKTIIEGKKSNLIGLQARKETLDAL